MDERLTPKSRYGVALVRSHASFELGYYEEAEESINLALAQQMADAKTRKDFALSLQQVFIVLANTTKMPEILSKRCTIGYASQIPYLKAILKSSHITTQLPC